ncbi:MAG: hypothetical protein EBX52_03225 [Proteobacteria bacterium]|nr:hypothetical protein [Pseudomonadota bacterium]
MENPREADSKRLKPGEFKEAGEKSLALMVRWERVPTKFPTGSLVSRMLARRFSSGSQWALALVTASRFAEFSWEAAATSGDRSRDSLQMRWKETGSACKAIGMKVSKIIIRYGVKRELICLYYNIIK